MIFRVDISPRGVCQPRPYWLIRDLLIGFDPTSSQLFRPTWVFSHTSVIGKHLQCERNLTSYLRDRSHEKSDFKPILSGWRVPSKHAQNEGEKHYNSSNSTKCNISMHELE